MKRYLALLSIITLTAIAAGCASAPSWLVSKTPAVARPAATNVVQVLKTNFVGVTTYLTNVVTVQAASTNAATGEIVPAVIQRQLSPIIQTLPVVSTNFETVITPAVQYTELGQSPTITGGLQLAGNLAPVPWASAAATGLLTISGWVFGFINNRNKKKALGESQSALDTATDIGTTLVANFEQLRKEAKAIPGYTEAIDAKVMQGVKLLQVAVGVKEDIEGILKSHRQEVQTA